MADELQHRGPDDEGFELFEMDGRQIGLGNRRLTIIDLTQGGHQPKSFEGNTVTYNGEIYNYVEIKKELEGLGYTFETTSDTEVLLKAYHKWGMDCLARFRGMWSFALWDQKKEQLILCRDRVGVKPLFWYHKNGVVLFSSELKAFHKHPRFEAKLDHNALTLFLQYGHVTAPYSIFQDGYKLEPGHYLTIDKNQNITKECYWSADKYFEEGQQEKDKWLSKSVEEVESELESILTESFNLRMVADVPVGVFLSGGIDSSLVTALLQKESSKPLKTFTIGFEEKAFNEAGYAKKVAEHLGTDHTELYCTPRQAFEIIPDLPRLYDEPFGGPSAIPTYLVSKLARQDVKVALSADGGDEQFYGYSHYWIKLARLNRLARFPYNLLNVALKLLDPILKTNGSGGIFPISVTSKYARMRSWMVEGSFIDKYDQVANTFLPQDLKSLGMESDVNQNYRFDKSFAKFGKSEQMMLHDINTFLTDQVMAKVDRATMGVSLEGREPLLDNKILEYSSKLPIKFKYHNGTAKYILKKILYKYVPREMLERPKQGFGVPIHEWFKNDMKELYIDQLNEKKIAAEGIFQPKAVNHLLQSHLKNKTIYQHSRKLWYLFIFSIWRDRYL